MKTNYITKIAVVAAVLTLGSCKDLLELQPQTALSDATAYQTPERVALVMAGVYDAAQSGFYAGGAVRGYPFGAAHISQGDNRGEDVINTQAFYQLTYANDITTVTPNNDFHFQTLFSLVNRANVTLAGLETVTPSAALTAPMIEAYKGECRLLRALAYIELLRHFAKPYSDNPAAATGGMPYRTVAVTSGTTAQAELERGRESVASNYTSILADLDFAESVLPTKAQRVAAQQITRATKGAAIALKTRVYLNMGNWAKVVEEGDKLLTATTSGTYTLTATPAGPFGAAASKSNSESIFSMENDGTDNASVNGSLSNVYGTSAQSPAARALVTISPIIWNQPWFLGTDARKGTTMVGRDEAVGAGGKAGYFSKKYTDVSTQSDNAPIIRLAEVYLNVAEALSRQSATPVARAHQLYYAVRGRANAAGTDASYDQVSDFVTGIDLTRAILNERRIEFLCEGIRWSDIHRLVLDPNFSTGGIPAKLAGNAAIGNYRPYYDNPALVNTALTQTSPGLRHNAIPYTGDVDNSKKFLWPIPASETALNPTLAGQQNAGW